MTVQAPRVFYRVVRHDPPTIDDFKSLADLGRRLPPNAAAELADAWAAVSAFVSAEGAAKQARANAARGRPLGDYVAELRLAADAPIRSDTPSRDGHVNLWAASELLLAAVALPVQSVESVLSQRPEALQ